MKLISVNIEVNRHHHTVLPFLKKEKPDVICMQELLDTDFDWYKKELGMEGIYKAFSYVNYQYPDKINGQKHGVGIFAKNIADSGHIFYYGKGMSKSFEEYLTDPENYRKNSLLLWADVKDNKGRLFKFANTHLPVTKQGEVTPYQREAVDTLLEALNSFNEFVLCGDMNAPRGGESFDRIAKKYRDNIPPEYKTSIDPLLHRVAKTKPNEIADKMVDGLFTTSEYKASNVELIDGVSDHMAIVAEIKRS